MSAAPRTRTQAVRKRPNQLSHGHDSKGESKTGCTHTPALGATPTQPARRNRCPHRATFRPPARSRQKQRIATISPGQKTVQASDVSESLRNRSTVSSGAGLHCHSHSHRVGLGRTMGLNRNRWCDGCTAGPAGPRTSEAHAPSGARGKRGRGCLGGQRARSTAARSSCRPRAICTSGRGSHAWNLPLPWRTRGGAGGSTCAGP